MPQSFSFVCWQNEIWKLAKWPSNNDHQGSIVLDKQWPCQITLSTWRSASRLQCGCSRHRLFVVIDEIWNSSPSALLSNYSPKFLSFDRTDYRQKSKTETKSKILQMYTVYSLAGGFVYLFLSWVWLAAESVVFCEWLSIWIMDECSLFLMICARVFNNKPKENYLAHVLRVRTDSMIYLRGKK